jgi:hypothetical protein
VVGSDVDQYFDQLRDAICIFWRKSLDVLEHDCTGASGFRCHCGLSSAGYFLAVIHRAISGVEMIA